MSALRKTILFAALASLVLAIAFFATQNPRTSQAAAPNDAQVREMEGKIQSLHKQLDELSAAPDAMSRQRIMQQNWRGMQDYMGWMHDRWGMGYPWMMGRDGPRNWRDGCPMMGDYPGSDWPLRGGIDPNQYSQQMQEHMRRMQEQMARIAQTADPRERQRLLQEHWQNMYRDMQTVRGMGWMWEGYRMGSGTIGGPSPSAKPLPEPSSEGARLVGTYCVQCHAAPQPSLHAAAEWSSVTQRMSSFMNSGLQGIKTPTEQEMKTILSYMQEHAQ